MASLWKYIKDLDPHSTPSYLICGVSLSFGSAAAGFYIARALQNNQIVGSNEEESIPLCRKPAKKDVVLEGSEEEQNNLLRNLSISSIDDVENEEIDSEDNATKLNRRKEAENLLTLLYNIGENQTKRESVVHRGISCNVCMANPLTGTRFKCANCVDFDVCARCEPSCDHDVTHVFLQLKIPIPRLANPTSALLQPFYPGNNAIQGNLTWTEVLELRQVTRLESSDVDAQYDLFKSLCTDKRGIDKSVFKHCLGPLGRQGNLIVDQLFNFYDQDRDAFINFTEFMKGLSILTNGNHSEQSRYIFEGYDIDNDGYISKDDLKQMLLAYHNISAEIVRDVVRSCEEEMMASYEDSASRPVSAVFNAPIPDFLSGYHGGPSTMKANLNSVVGQDARPLMRQRTRSRTTTTPGLHAMTQDAVTELVDNIFTLADNDKDGKLSYKEFKAYATVDPSILAWFEAVSTIF